jgi:hypothetical protein
MNENKFTVGEKVIVVLAAKLSNSTPEKVIKSAGILGALISVSNAIAAAVETGEYSFLADHFSEIIEESQRALKNEITELSEKVKTLNSELELMKNIVKDLNSLPTSEMQRLGITYSNKKFFFEEHGRKFE